MNHDTKGFLNDKTHSLLFKNTNISLGPVPWW